MGESFRWLSPLGASVGLFLAIGLLWLLIGALTVPFHNRGTGTEMIFVSHSTDREYFGTSPSEILSADPALSKLRTLLLTVIAGFLLLAGILCLSVAWFGLKQGERWALVSLASGGLVAIAFWALALLPYFRSGIPVTIGDPILLGWMGLG